MLTPEVMQRCMPPKYKGRLTDENVSNINKILEDCDHRDAVKDNILGFTTVLNSPHYSLKEYVNAVRYITYTMTGDTNIRAWTKVFPERYSKLLAKGIESKDINAHVRHYNLTKLVNEIREQSLVPSSILNADVYQRAINKQVSLMNTAKSEQVQQKAADSLLLHLKRPDTTKIELDIGMKDSSIIDALKETTTKLAAKQLELLEAKVINNQDVAYEKIVTVAYKEDSLDGE